MWKFYLIFVFVPVMGSDVPPYIKQCYEGDPEVIQCFKKAIHHLRPYLQKGIAEIELPSVEPFKMDELTLSLTTGPQGYKVSLKNIDVFGASQFTVENLKLSSNNEPFEAKIQIPQLTIDSSYESSGVLIILPASGNGTFNGKLDDISAMIRGTASVQEKNGLKYLHVDTLKMELDVKDLNLQVKNLYRNNMILTQAINLFLRQNGKEVFNVMLPQLKQKLSVLFLNIANTLLSNVPLTTFYVPKKEQCYKDDINVNTCLKQSTNFLIANLRNGIPELDIYDPEPIVIDQIQLALGTGPDGYRAIFRDIEAFGVSNISVAAVRSDLNTHQYQFTMFIPRITAKAKYESSGILILIQASGGGNYWGEYEGVKIKVYLRGSPRDINGRTYLIVQQMKMDFNVKEIKMGVDGIHNGNTVLQISSKMFLVVFLIGAVHILRVSSGELPSFIHVCQRDDPNLIPCLIASVEDLRPYLVEGVPEYNIPKLEPLVMTDFFSEEAAGMKITVSNVSAWGCSDYFVRGLEVNLENHNFVINIDLPKLRIEAHYNVDGKLLVMPIKGDGNLEANITDTTARAELTGELYEKNGESYLRYHTFDLKVHVGGGTSRLANLFNGDKVLLGMINDVVNKNFDMFIKELMPIIQKSLAAVFKETANAIVENFTYEQLFP
ncbi:uncharacterized protein LOC130442972 [Diorhabda sublineata]|uniref:uncharacterized protein LOC130442972 n=1 Tax=Diorhabda sublineata TaxID=1163346 RepID=UPI0024E06D11|nr:uncharacterized protein LOC130442972 [Diorhabda sublineata]